LKIDGYEVFGYKLITDGNGHLIDAERPCDCCLKGCSKKIKVSLEGMWEEKKVCKACMIKGGLFLDDNDLEDALDNI